MNFARLLCSVALLLNASLAHAQGFKIADIDPRESQYANCFTISDKARCRGGAVLTALLSRVTAFR